MFKQVLKFAENCYIILNMPTTQDRAMDIWALVVTILIPYRFFVWLPVIAIAVCVFAYWRTQQQAKKIEKLKSEAKDLKSKLLKRARTITELNKKLNQRSQRYDEPATATNKFRAKPSVPATAKSGRVFKLPFSHIAK